MDISVYKLLQEILPYFIVCFFGVFIYLALLSITYQGLKFITDMQREMEKRLEAEKKMQIMRESAVADLARTLRTSLVGKETK